QVVAGHRRRILRPGGESGAHGHVQHVHAVRQGHLHGIEHDVGGGGTVAAEYPVGPERHIRRHATYAAFGRIPAGPDDAGHVRAVPVAVVRIGIRVRFGLIGRAGGVGVVVIADEVVPHGDTVGGEGGAVSFTAQIR